MLFGAIKNFIKESNRIEGITSYPVEALFELHKNFFDLQFITIEDICNFVNRTAGPKAPLRDSLGLNVTVGDHKPMLGGISVRAALQEIIDDINSSDRELMKINVAYDTAMAHGKWIRSFDEEAVVQRRNHDIKILHEAGYGPFELHNRFAHLHPFMDGNGRTARAIWARQMVNHWGYNFNPGFLHTYYYQALNAADKIYNNVGI